MKYSMSFVSKTVFRPAMTSCPMAPKPINAMRFLRVHGVFRWLTMSLVTSLQQLTPQCKLVTLQILQDGFHVDPILSDEIQRSLLIALRQSPAHFVCAPRQHGNRVAHKESFLLPARNRHLGAQDLQTDIYSLFFHCQGFAGDDDYLL